MPAQNNQDVQDDKVPAVPSNLYKDKGWFYLLQKKLGSGFDGEVWKAKMKIQETDPVSNTRLAARRIYVCLKKFRHNRNEDLYFKRMEALLKELETAECLKGSRYVLEVKEFMKTDNNFSLVMQLCNGGNLLQLINDAYLDKVDPVRPKGFSQQALRGIMF